jgi:hypothetical protein
MQQGIILRIMVIVGFIVGIACAAAHAAPEATQTFTLHPGWNAVFLEVQPEPHDPATVFEGLPVESVWTWLERHTIVEFIQSPNEGLWGQPGWHAYFTAEKETFLTNLFAIFANWSYLIKLKGSENVTWTVTGAPSVKKLRWTPDSFNLVGFHVDPGSSPLVKDFFAPSTAHAGQAVYRLNRQGKWEFVEKPSETSIRSGESFWVYCESASTYQGPLNIKLPLSDGLNYGAMLTELTITLQNLSEVPRTVLFKLSTANVVMVYRQYDPSTGYFTWPLLENMPPLTIEPGRYANVRIGVRREAMAAGVAESILEMKDDKGVRVLVPVSVEKIGG